MPLFFALQSLVIGDVENFMIKRITVEQLRLGMYLHELGCAWMDHPFWRKTFLLDDPKDLQIILSARIKWVKIDTAQGLDVANASDAGSVDDGDQQAVAETIAVTPAQDAPITAQRRSVSQEAAQAVKICAKSKQAVASMFGEARMGKALNCDDALPLVEEISNSVLRNPDALISLARLKNKDDYTYMHSVAVCALMVALARRLGLNEAEVREAGLAGLLHDIGKMMIPMGILDKPGKLTDAEFAIVKNHPSEGHKMLLQGSGVSEVALDVCLHHHEKVDGSGYPEHLSEQQISLYAKMGAVCDVYDAITSNRPYKSGWEPAESLRRMAEWRKGHFDQRIFEAFVRSVGIYPIGSLVQLKSGRLGVVIAQTANSLLTPTVKIFFSTRSNGRIQHEIVDLSLPGCQDKIVSYEDPAKWNITDIHELWSGAADTSW